MGTCGSRDAATERTGRYLQPVPIGGACLNVSSINAPMSASESLEYFWGPLRDSRGPSLCLACPAQGFGCRMSHSEHTELSLFNLAIMARRNRQPQHYPCIRRINHTVIPKPG